LLASVELANAKTWDCDPGLCSRGFLLPALSR